MKTDLKRLQNNYFEASVNNAKIANEAIAKAHNGILILGIAELAFLGNKIFNNQIDTFLKIEITLIIVALLSFFLGAISEYKHILKVARKYHKLSLNITNFIETQDKTEIEKLPKCLSGEDDSIKSDSSANNLFTISIGSIFLSTIILLIEILIK